MTALLQGRQALQDDGLRKRIYFLVVVGPVKYKRVVIVFFLINFEYTQNLSKRKVVMKNVMTGRLGGFTLIELLVVVLIIGILAAIALPQYEKAVEKSRAAEALTNLRALVNAMQVAKMANGSPVQTLDALDIELSGEKIDERTVKLKNFTYDIRNSTHREGFEVVATRNNATSDLQKYYIYHSYSGEMICVALKPAAETPCKALCGNHQFAPHTASGGTAKSCFIF